MRHVIELRSSGSDSHHERKDVNLTHTRKRVAGRTKRTALPTDAGLDGGAPAQRLLQTPVELRTRGAASFALNTGQLVRGKGRFAGARDLLGIPLRQQAHRVDRQAVRAEEEARAIGREKGVAIASGDHRPLRGAMAHRLIRVAARRTEEIRTGLPGAGGDLLQRESPGDRAKVLRGVDAVAGDNLHGGRKGGHG